MAGQKSLGKESHGNKCQAQVAQRALLPRNSILPRNLILLDKDYSVLHTFSRNREPDELLTGVIWVRYAF